MTYFSLHQSVPDSILQPWRIKYKRQDLSKVSVAMLYNRNSELEVTEKGIYEIVAVRKIF